MRDEFALHVISLFLEHLLFFFDITKIEFVLDDVPLNTPVEFHLSFTETTKEFQYAKTSDTEAYCGGVIGLL